MPKPIHLFVSSSPDLYTEREIVGQVVASLKLMLGWRIGHTPRPGDSAEDSALWVEECDLYTLILGQDFAAPMGDELRKALNKGIRPLAFRKQCTPSPSAQNTLHHVRLDWQVFSTPEQFRQMFTKHLLKLLVEHAEKLELNLGDLAGLAGLLEPQKEAEAQVGPAVTDAGHSGVILGREVLRRTDS